MELTLNFSPWGLSAGARKLVKLQVDQLAQLVCEHSHLTSGKVVGSIPTVRHARLIHLAMKRVRSSAARMLPSECREPRGVVQLEVKKKTPAGTPSEL